MHLLTINWTLKTNFETACLNFKFYIRKKELHLPVRE